MVHGIASWTTFVFCIYKCLWVLPSVLFLCSLNLMGINSSPLPISSVGKYLLVTNCLLFAESRLPRFLLFLNTVKGVLGNRL